MALLSVMERRYLGRMALKIEFSVGAFGMHSVGMMVLVCDPKSEGFPEYGSYTLDLYGLVSERLIYSVNSGKLYKRDIGCFQLLAKILQDHDLPNLDELERRDLI